MKKVLVSLIMAATMTMNACQDQNAEVTALKSRVDDLEKQLAETYKPGFGEFMSGIQVHHAKLWFAGLNQNWKLADFEVHEIMEALEDLQKYQSGRTETRLIPTLNPAIEGVNEAIKKQDVISFKSSYMSLTEACNNCHRDVNYEFNMVKIPDRPPFSNQIFNTQK
ncbi:MAG TPA: hypothetical protein PK228_15920 [Saprospiraceae bacterium]|nr:hypothetical protein [Saprospiraceae bacterium]